MAYGGFFNMPIAMVQSVLMSKTWKVMERSWLDLEMTSREILLVEFYWVTKGGFLICRSDDAVNFNVKVMKDTKKVTNWPWNDLEWHNIGFVDMPIVMVQSVFTSRSRRVTGRSRPDLKMTLRELSIAELSLLAHRSLSTCRSQWWGVISHQDH